MPSENPRLSQSPYNAPTPNGPQVGMVHPLPHGQHGSPHGSAATYAPGSASGVYAPGLERQRSYSNPRKTIHMINRRLHLPKNPRNTPGIQILNKRRFKISLLVAHKKTIPIFIQTKCT